MALRGARLLLRIVGIALLVVPLLPVSRWAGADDPGPVWGPNLAAWGLGLAMVGVLALAFGRLQATRPLPRLRVPRIATPVTGAGIGANRTVSGRPGGPRCHDAASRRDRRDIGRSRRCVVAVRRCGRGARAIRRTHQAGARLVAISDPGRASCRSGWALRSGKDPSGHRTPIGPSDGAEPAHPGRSRALPVTACRVRV